MATNKPTAQTSPSRRRFLKTTAATGISAAVPYFYSSAIARAEDENSKRREGFELS